MSKTTRQTASGATTKRPRVMDEVTKSIASDILSGRRKPGSSLPTENELCTDFGVSRTVIREVLKVLAAKGLVHTRPRIGTLVCDEENWNIIDPQVLSWHTADVLDKKLVSAILEVRRGIEPLVAEIAASRASLREIADLEAAWQGMAEADTNIEKFTRADIDFHQILYAATHNPIFRQIGNIIDTALNVTLSLAAANSLDQRAEAIIVHKALVEALRMRDEAAARIAANRILDLAVRDLAESKRRAADL